MTAWTDDDVTAVAEILATCYDSRPALSEDAEWILRTVAPAIAARALREAAAFWDSLTPEAADELFFDVSDWLRARAERVTA